jgi:hypothetical protein
MGMELKKYFRKRTVFCLYLYICFNFAFSRYDFINQVYLKTHCDCLDNIGNDLNRGFNINFCLHNGNMIKNVNFLFMTLMSFLVAVEDSKVTPSDYATLIEMVSIV